MNFVKMLVEIPFLCPFGSVWVRLRYVWVGLKSVWVLWVRLGSFESIWVYLGPFEFVWVQFEFVSGGFGSVSVNLSKLSSLECIRVHKSALECIRVRFRSFEDRLSQLVRVVPTITRIRCCYNLSNNLSNNCLSNQ